MYTQGCYGGNIRDAVPEGDWLCQACCLNLTQVQCVLCPVPHGPVKPTDGLFACLALVRAPMCSCSPFTLSLPPLA